MSRADEFIDLYKQLEDAAVQRYNYPTDGRAVLRLQDRREFASVRSELSYCREVRNLLQHKPKLDGQFLVQPSEEMLQFLQGMLHRIEHPVRCRDVAIPFEKMYWKTMADPVLPAVRVLKNAIHTHIPILEERRVVGIFTVNGLFNHLVDKGEGGLAETTLFSDMGEFLRLDNHPSEVYLFARADTPLDELEESFQSARETGRRVGMVFLTHSGKSTEKVLGILTAWDMIGQ